MELNTHRLSIFLRVLEHGGFSAAAEKLYMSQPSVSNQVRALETTLRTQLVDRSGARIRPTEEGRVLADYARRILLLMDEAVTAVERVRGLQQGSLAIGGTTTIGTYLLPGLVARFHAVAPDIACDIRVGNEHQVVKWLLDGEIGLGVFAGEPAAEQLSTRRIGTDEMVLIGAPGDTQSLAEQRFLLRERGSSTRERQEAAMRALGIDPASASELWGSETLKRGVRAGLGVAVVSAHTVADELREGTLCTIPADPPLPARPVTMARRTDRLLSPAERAFTELLGDIGTESGEHE
ncbi:LysR family transcriptional regulator [Sciscionella sediminilitoris]|uniref:LysR family transcriptional regulator n=1 Tax=Sciscionella sediminilitoris TaxID=1445613 RepID=UPI0004DFB2EA|nr:LysR substrate-binding domain-containing protein [Sciscionella sp. SE31]